MLCAICRKKIESGEGHLDLTTFEGKKPKHNMLQVHSQGQCPSGIDHLERAKRREPSILKKSPDDRFLLDTYYLSLIKPKVKSSLVTSEPKQSATPVSDKGFIITSAMNNTLVNNEFFQNLRAYAKFKGYQLLVGCERYQNPTSPEASRSQDERYWWDRKLTPYLITKELDLFGDGRVKVAGDARVRATTTNPLAVFNNTASGSVNILPFGKLRYKHTPVKPSEDYAGVVTTTGSCTPYEYSLTSTGYRSNYEHVLGALIVDKRDDGYFNLRQVQADSSNGIADLCWYTVNGSTEYKKDNVAGLYLADLHIEEMSEVFLSQTIELIKTLNIEEAVVGDVLSVDYESHHKRLLDKVTKPYVSVTASLESLAKTLVKLTSATNLTVADSNHHNHLAQWVERVYAKSNPDPKELKDHSLFAYLLFQRESKNLIRDYFKLELGGKYYLPVEWLSNTDDKTIAGIRVSDHGHTGINGARGSTRAYASLNTPICLGHTHSGEIYNGVFRSGVSNLTREFDYANKGYSNWSQTNILIYSNGTRSLVNLINGRFI